MKREQGFTLIEILMVILLVGILAAVAIPQFINYQAQARQAAASSSLGALRTGISNQYSQMLMRCGAAAGTYPSAASLAANDVTTGGQCTVAQVPAGQREFVVGSIPNNPYGTTNTVTNCRAAGGDCTRNDATFCDGTATATNTWCYDPTTGQIWTDTSGEEGL